MTALVQEIENKAQHLSSEERELLAEHLLATTDDASFTPIDEVWFAEAERRYSEWKAGRSRLVPVQQAMTDIRKELGG